MTQLTPKYDTVIFDLDGTLLYTLTDLTTAVNAAMRRFGWQERTFEEMRHFVGNGIRNLMDHAVPGGEKNPLFEEAFAVQTLNDDFFHMDIAIGEREGVARKPAPDSVFLAMNELSAEPSRTVYIGDSDVDLKTAKNSGLPCISALWGFRTREELKSYGATCIADTPADMVAEILGTTK